MNKVTLQQNKDQIKMHCEHFRDIATLNVFFKTSQLALFCFISKNYVRTHY